MSNYQHIKRGWLTFGEKKIYLRSAWEAKYASYLQALKTRKVIQDWDYEPETFWFEGIKRGCVSYKPDFRVVDDDGSIFWVEVKGYMDAKSKTKIKRFKKYFPDQKLVVIDSDWFRKNSKKLAWFCNACV